MDAMMDMREAAQGAGGEARGANARFAAVSSDTRTIAEGALFVALRGERFDGHDYLAAARARGAVAAMVDRRARRRRRRCAAAAARRRRHAAGPGPARRLLARQVHTAADRRDRFERQDHSEGNDCRHPDRTRRARTRIRDAGQPQQRHRCAADAARPARAAYLCRGGAGHEPRRGNRLPRGNSAADGGAGEQRPARTSGIHAQRRGGGARTWRGVLGADRPTAWR